VSGAPEPIHSLEKLYGNLVEFGKDHTVGARQGLSGCGRTDRAQKKSYAFILLQPADSFLTPAFRIATKKCDNGTWMSLFDTAAYGLDCLFVMPETDDLLWSFGIARRVQNIAEIVANHPRLQQCQIGAYPRYQL